MFSSDWSTTKIEMKRNYTEKGVKEMRKNGMKDAFEEIYYNYTFLSLLPLPTHLTKDWRLVIKQKAYDERISQQRKFITLSWNLWAGCHSLGIKESETVLGCVSVLKHQPINVSLKEGSWAEFHPVTEKLLSFALIS